MQICIETDIIEFTQEVIKIGKADSNINTSSFAWRLHNLRDKHGLSQMQLAKELHTTSSQISRIESRVTEYHSIEIVFMFQQIICLESLRSLQPKVMIYRNLDCRKNR